MCISTYDANFILRMASEGVQKGALAPLVTVQQCIIYDYGIEDECIPMHAVLG